MKILMMGPQGCGKGTLGKMVSEYCHLPLISTGQILRSLDTNHPWYKEVNDSMNDGSLVDQKKVAVLLGEELTKEKYKNGFVLDGWYRSMKDTKAYEVPLDKAFLLNTSPETSVLRLSTRRTCQKCGAIYSTIFVTQKPKTEGICDKCGGTLEQREDDTEEAILKRLGIYHDETSDVIAFLKEKGILIEIDGEGPPKEVFDRIVPYLE
jgi:adenylate kinase